MKDNKKLRYSWIYDGSEIRKKEQILEIEGYHFPVKILMTGLNPIIEDFVRQYPIFLSKQQEIKRIMEDFLIDVAESKDLTGEME